MLCQLLLMPLVVGCRPSSCPACRLPAVHILFPAKPKLQEQVVVIRLFGAARNDIEESERRIDRPAFSWTGEVRGMRRTPHRRVRSPHRGGLVSVSSVEVCLYVGDRPAPGPVAQGLLEGRGHHREWLVLRRRVVVIGT